MRALVATGLLLVLVSGCGDETAPSDPPAPATASCEEYADVLAGEDPQALAELVADEELSEAEREGLRLLTEPGIAPPDEPREQQAVLAFSGYLEDRCPDLGPEVESRLGVTVDPIDEPTTTPSSSPSPSPSPSPSQSPSPSSDGPDRPEVVPTPEPGSFCESWVEVLGESFAGSYDVGDQVRRLQQWLVRVDREGLADDLPDEARAGLRVFEDLVGPLDPATVTERDMDRRERRLTPEQERLIESFGDWVDEHCTY